MTSDRLVALTDGVVAVIITIMVLEMKAPEGTHLADLARLWPVLLSYLLSFVYVAIYWNNHHHFFHLAPEVDGTVMWSNFGLLFCLSLVPLASAWTGEHPFAATPAAVYGVVLLATAIAWYVMQTTVVRAQGPASPLAHAIGADWKGKLSPLLYVLGIALAFVASWAAYVVYALVAAMWLVPDRRVRRAIERG